MVRNRDPLSSDELQTALAIADKMKEHPSNMMHTMIQLEQSQDDTEGTWPRAIRQAIANFEKLPHLYRKKVLN